MFYSQAIKPPGGHMEGIKPTRVKEGTGWRRERSWSDTYLSWGIRVGTRVRGGLAGEEGADVAGAEKRQKAGFSSFTAEKRG